MQQQAAGVDKAPDLASFAGLLATLTAAKPGPAGDLEGLEDDVATLSYERALHTHARYKPGTVESWETGTGPAPALPAGVPDARDAVQDGQAGLAARLEQNRKRASVTIRVSKAEGTQLQQRAAEAGLTVSAYLRSCAFEVEALRAQVKQALAELRAEQAAAERPALLRLFSRRRGVGASQS